MCVAVPVSGALGQWLTLQWRHISRSTLTEELRAASDNCKHKKKHDRIGSRGAARCHVSGSAYAAHTYSYTNNTQLMRPNAIAYSACNLETSKLTDIQVCKQKILVQTTEAQSTRIVRVVRSCV